MDVAEHYGAKIGSSASCIGKEEPKVLRRHAWSQDAVASPAVAPSEKERLLTDHTHTEKGHRRALLRNLLRWKKQRISPLLGTAVSSDEVEWKEPLHTVKAESLWTNLPEHLLEAILTLIKDGKDSSDWSMVQAHFQIAAVCKAWRKCSKSIFFAHPWTSVTTLCHPLQLFSTRVGPTANNGAGNLLRCFVRRDAGGESAVAKFRLFLGSEHNDPDACKFLMAALLNSRWETMLFLTADCKSAPAAKLRSNTFGTHYELKLDASMLPFDHDWSAAAAGKDDSRGAHGRCDALLDVQYKTRLKGFMRPRRMKVTLPPVSVLDRFRSAKGLAAERAAAAAVAAHEGEESPRRNRENGRTALARRRHDATASPNNDNSSEPASVSSPTADRAGSRTGDQGGALHSPSSSSHALEGVERVDPVEGMELRNKPPHWNQDLRCWCLNFRGRVKLASVKNFQLICATDPSKSIVMQFGKVDAHTYIMDFNPNIVSTAQAFAVALSTFDTKVLL